MTSFSVLSFSMRSFFQKHHRVLFYSSWIILGFIQSRLTELLDDEAYYWVYSKFLDWGYFDHPPMVALLIKMGYSIFHNELGARLFFLLLNVLSLFLMERLIEKKGSLIFYAIALSLAIIRASRCGRPASAWRIDSRLIASSSSPTTWNVPSVWG